MASSVSIVRPREEHRSAWDGLYRGYAVEQTDAMRDRVWSWLDDPDHAVKGFLALNATGMAVGLAHYRPFARPLMASTGGFLDDLFVSPEARGLGTAQALIAAVCAEGRARGWTAVRWITAEGNYRARAAYDRLATKTPWVTYDIRL